MLKRIPQMIAAVLPVVVSIPSTAVIRKEGDPLPSHHHNGIYQNPWSSYVQINPFSPYTLWSMFQEWTSRPVPPPELLPHVVKPNWGIKEGATITDMEDWRKDVKATWCGHACFLVEFPSVPGSTERGPRILFDPCFSQRCSPSQIVGPKRVTQPPFPLEELPHVDAVVYSHNHYDHLSAPAVETLYSKQDKGTLHFFAPLGNSKWFENLGVDKQHVTEMDWWEERDITISQNVENGSTTTEPIQSHLRLTCTPAQHFSGRGILDRMHTLWSSWSISQLSSAESTTSTSRIWFGGDTGYKSVPRHAKTEEGLPTCPAYKEIGERLGPFDLSLIPIGAYEPRFFMSPIHCSPEDAVEVHKEVKSKKSIGMHWGTWILTCEEMTEPPKRLRTACEANGITKDEFDVCHIGETVSVTPTGEETKL